MDTPRLISKKGVLIDLALALAFYVFMLGCVQPHVPLEVKDYPIASPLIAYATTACLTGVFWLALGCFRVTWADQRMRRKAECNACSCRPH